MHNDKIRAQGQPGACIQGLRGSLGPVCSKISLKHGVHICGQLAVSMAWRLELDRRMSIQGCSGQVLVQVLVQVAVAVRVGVSVRVKVAMRARGLCWRRGQAATPRWSGPRSGAQMSRLLHGDSHDCGHDTAAMTLRPCRQGKPHQKYFGTDAPRTGGRAPQPGTHG